MSKKEVNLDNKLTRGKMLGKYRIQKLLGQGGFCQVFKARDTVEGVWVALKTPQINNGVEPDNKAILREVKLVAKLRHKNIMPLKNADIIDNRAVLATELCVATLADGSKPMTVKRIVPIIAQVLNGLAYAHRRKLVHCDVTPGNIFLFPDGRAAIGDFGISLYHKGKIKTSDDYGTPGYIAVEQAFGKPSYRSDCFAAALILYEYLTGFLPRWPFKWPFRGMNRLREKCSGREIGFLRKALQVNPDKRFVNADAMLKAMMQVYPDLVCNAIGKARPKNSRIDWRKTRRQAFLTRYGQTLPAKFSCVNCSEPIAETMLICPWCGSNKNCFDDRTAFSHVCPNCHKGVLPEWKFCPWCYTAGFKSPGESVSPGHRYHSKCKHCKGKLMRFMRYCPWCHRKVKQKWHIQPFPEVCSRCDGPIDSDFWNHCPWCKLKLV